MFNTKLIPKYTNKIFNAVPNILCKLLPPANQEIISHNSLVSTCVLYIYCDRSWVCQVTKPTFMWGCRLRNIIRFFNIWCSYTDIQIPEIKLQWIMYRNLICPTKHTKSAFLLFLITVSKNVLSPSSGGSIFIRNICTHLPKYITPQYKSTIFRVTSAVNPQISLS